MSFTVICNNCKVEQEFKDKAMAFGNKIEIEVEADYSQSGNETINIYCCKCSNSIDII